MTTAAADLPVYVPLYNLLILVLCFTACGSEHSECLSDGTDNEMHFLYRLNSTSNDMYEVAIPFGCKFDRNDPVVHYISKNATDDRSCFGVNPILDCLWNFPKSLKTDEAAFSVVSIREKLPLTGNELDDDVTKLSESQTRYAQRRGGTAVFRYFETFPDVVEVIEQGYSLTREGFE